MCYPKDMSNDKIETKFPEIMEMNGINNDPLPLLADNLINPMISFTTFIGDVILWLYAMKLTRDEMSISRVMFKMLFDFHSVIKNKMIEIESTLPSELNYVPTKLSRSKLKVLKLIYGRALANERRYESIVNKYITVLEDIRSDMDQTIREFENSVGNMNLMINQLNSFYQYSDAIMDCDFRTLAKIVINANEHYRSAQISLYKKFVKFYDIKKNSL